MATKETEALVYAPDDVVTCEGCMMKLPIEFALPSGDEPGYNCPKCVLLAVDHQFGEQRKRYEGFVHALVKFRSDPRALARLLFLPEDVALASQTLEAISKSFTLRELDARAPDCVGCLMASPLTKLHTCAKKAESFIDARKMYSDEEQEAIDAITSYVVDGGPVAHGKIVEKQVREFFVELAEWRRSGTQAKKLDPPASKA